MVEQGTGTGRVTLRVDGEVFEVTERQADPGVYDFDWVSGAPPGMASPPGRLTLSLSVTTNSDRRSAGSWRRLATRSTCTACASVKQRGVGRIAR